MVTLMCIKTTKAAIKMLRIASQAHLKLPHKQFIMNVLTTQTNLAQSEKKSYRELSVSNFLYFFQFWSFCPQDWGIKIAVFK